MFAGLNTYEIENMINAIEEDYSILIEHTDLVESFDLSYCDDNYNFYRLMSIETCHPLCQRLIDYIKDFVDLFKHYYTEEDIEFELYFVIQDVKHKLKTNCM
jgi:hypothetical protein